MPSSFVLACHWGRAKGVQPGKGGLVQAGLASAYVSPACLQQLGWQAEAGV